MGTTKTEQLAAADAVHLAATDAAQQRYRAAIEGPLADYVAAIMPARAEFEAAEELASRVYAETVNAINAP